MLRTQSRAFMSEDGLPQPIEFFVASDASAIVEHTKMDVSSINGTWEAFMSKEVNNPLPGVSKAYVIMGADKRGTIFGLYDHSEQFGVSPWYW